MELIRILLADDHTLFRDGLRSLLASVPDAEVVGEAATGAEAVDQAAALQPDVVLMDIQMPGINGIEATRRITAANLHIGVIVVTMFEDDDSVFAAMRAGARGYVLKGADAPRAAAQAEIFPELTEREREVLGLIAQGHNNEEIARPKVTTTRRSRASWCSARKPCATTSATSSASCRSPTGRRPSCGRARRGWGAGNVKREAWQVSRLHASRCTGIFGQSLEGLALRGR